MKTLRKLIGLKKYLKFFPNHGDVIIQTNRMTSNSYAPGKMVEESRQLSVFNQLAMFGAMDVEWKKSDVFSITILAEEGSAKAVTTDIRNNKLSIELANDYCGGSITVILYCPELNRIEHEGPGDFLAKSVSNESLEITKGGPGYIFMEGNTQCLTINNEGPGTIQCDGLDCKMATVNQDGAGDIKINGNAKTLFVHQDAPGLVSIRGLNSEQITVTHSSAGELELKGSTNELDIMHRGAGDISAKDMISQHLTLISSGPGNNKATAKVEAKIFNKGAGNINIYGKPEKVTQHGKGPGTVNFH